MRYKVEEAFNLAKGYGVVSNKKVFYRWLKEGSLKSEKIGKERHIEHDDLMAFIEEKMHPFVKALIEENKRLKQALQKN